MDSSIQRRYYLLWAYTAFIMIRMFTYPPYLQSANTFVVRPPFAAAASHDEPDYINLGHAPTRSQPPSAVHSPSHDELHSPTTTPTIARSPGSSTRPTTQRTVSFASSAMASPWLPTDNTPQTAVTEDEQTSSSRSKRLLSGYIFGNPPTPAAVSDERRGMSGILETVPPPRDGRERTPTPPETTSDSPPVTEPPTAQPSPSTSAASLGDSPRGNQQMASLAKRRSSKSRDRDTGYDALNGLNDGEADLDESAPPAVFGSEAYMRGVEGVEYRFPRHRLRRGMKGKLRQG
jgi:nicotinamide mononucleotide adenylyltransferase